MPRRLRHYLPGIPAHIIARGNNRQACFYVEPDYRFYLDCLEQAATDHGVAGEEKGFGVNLQRLHLPPAAAAAPVCAEV